MPKVAVYKDGHIVKYFVAYNYAQRWVNKQYNRDEYTIVEL